MSSSKETVVFMVFSEKGLLVEKRDLTKKDDPGLTVIPGGWVDEDETKEKALVRECREELGITLKKFKFICSLSYPTTQLFYYLIEEYEGEIFAKENQELFWIEEQDYETKLDLQEDKEALKRI